MITLLDTDAQPVDKNSPIPFYYQIVQSLRIIIQDVSETRPEEEVIPLPSELTLCEIFEVNRGTIRHAFDVLEREGLIFRTKGKGTFVQRRRVELDLNTLCSTTADLEARGWQPETRVIQIEKIQPRLHIQYSLNLNKEELVWQVYRLRFANGEPISIQWSCIPVKLTPGLDQYDLQHSLYDALKTKYKIELRNANQLIRARAATHQEAELLNIESEAPVFDISRTTYDSAQRAIEHLESIWRCDRYDFRVRLTSTG